MTCCWHYQHRALLLACANTTLFPGMFQPSEVGGSVSVFIYWTDMNRALVETSGHMWHQEGFALPRGDKAALLSDINVHLPFQQSSSTSVWNPRCYFHLGCFSKALRKYFLKNKQNFFSSYHSINISTSDFHWKNGLGRN